MNKLLRVLLPVLLATLFLVGAVTAANQIPLPERAAPDYGPPGVRVVTVNTSVITDDTNFANINAQGYTYLDLFYEIDQVAGAVPNTTTLELEVSPDAIDWYNHNDTPNLLANNAADASGYVDSTAVEGYQIRVVANTTNNNPITPSLKIVLR